MKWPQVITHVCFPKRDRTYAPAISGFIAESVHWQEPPEPVRYGDFWATGKDTRHAWPHRYIYQTDNSDSTLTIMAGPGASMFPTIPSALVVGMSAMTPHQAQNPKADPVSIQTPAPTAWGAQAQLAPLVGYSPKYAKLF